LGVVDAEFAHRINRRVTFTIVPRGESLEPEKLEQPPAPQPGPNIKIVEKIVEKEITVPELVVTDRVIFPNIYFEYDKATLTPEGLDNTKRAATLVKNMDRLRKVTVEGHCDWRGTDAYNDALSMRRANTVKNKMIELGVDAAILDAVGYGERHPIASNETSLGMALNRRVEFKIEYR
jgi:outer membrane protein OmpA-like peptidoglycan-associated protein